MQAVPWNGDKADIKKIVNHSEEVGMRVNGMQKEIDGVTYTVEDRGGAIQGNRIDIYMNSHAEALAWGVKYLPVEVIN